MEAYTVIKNSQAGGPHIKKGIAVTNRNRITLGSIDEDAGVEHVPLSTTLQESLPETNLLLNASVKRSATSIKFLAHEKVEGDKAGAVLVLISIEPREDETTIITKAEAQTKQCSYQGWTNNDMKVCDDCGVEYVILNGETVYTHPKSGHYQHYSEHLPHQVTKLGEGPHLRGTQLVHKDILAVMEPGARIRIANMKGKQVRSEYVLVRTHTELDFAKPGDIYLASELSEENAAFI